MQPNDVIEDVYVEYSPRLLKFIRSQVKTREDAEDILQDVFFQLARAGDSGESGIERMSSWLYRVARNSVINFWRKKREYPVPLYDADDEICDELSRTLSALPQDAPDAVYLRKLVWIELDSALSEMPPEQCEVFCLTVFDGMPVKEISAITGVAVPTLLSRKYYAVKFLRRRFHSLYDALMISD